MGHCNTPGCLIGSGTRGESGYATREHAAKAVEFLSRVVEGINFAGSTSKFVKTRAGMLFYVLRIYVTRIGSLTGPSRVIDHSRIWSYDSTLSSHQVGRRRRAWVCICSSRLQVNLPTNTTSPITSSSMCGLGEATLAEHDCWCWNFFFLFVFH